MSTRRLYRLSDPELQERLSLRETSLRRLVSRGLLPARTVLGILMVAEDDIDELVDRTHSPPVSAK